MSEQLEILGHWWFPENPEKTVAGTLYIFEDDYANLEIIEPLLTIEDIRRGRSNIDIGRSLKRKSIILGRSDKGEQITLVDNIYNEAFIAFGGKTNIQSYYVLFGAHFEERQNIRFNEIRVFYEDFGNWLNHAWITYKEEKKDSGNSYTLNHTEKMLNDILLSNKTHFQIHSKANITLPSDKKEVNIKSQFFISLNNDDGFFYDYLNQIDKIKNLLSIFMQKPINISQIIGLHKIDNKNRRIKIYYPKDYVEHDRRIKPLIKEKQIKDLKKILNTWFSMNSGYQIIINLYLLNLNTPNFDRKTRFLNYIRALEGYHRLTTPVRNDTKKAYKKKINILLQDLSKEERKNYLQILAHGYEPKLIERLEDIYLKILTNYTAIIFGNTKERIPLFLDEIKGFRNTLTHLDVKNRKKEISNYRLSSINLYLHKTLTILILKTLALDEDTIYEAVKDYPF